MSGGADSSVSLPKQGKNLQPAFYGFKLYHVTSIFYCLVSYVYCLIAPAAPRQASFLSHLTSFTYFLLPIVLRSSAYCLPSALICHMSVLLWLHQHHSRAHHHHMATAAATAPFMATFYDKFCRRDDATGFGHVLRFKVWKLRLSRSNLWHKMTNSSGCYAVGLAFCHSMLDSFSSLSEIWRLIIWIGCQKIWRPKTDVNKFIYLWLTFSLGIRRYKLI